ncbi:MAG: cardiolipin synthase B [Balneolaceae bacterium]|nr:cardiolipin synthase B [Balneolaceae bacterium]
MKTRDQYRHVLENTLGIPFTEHNAVDVLVNGKEIFPAMLEAINNAERQIDFLTFVYWTGKAAQDFAHALAKKAEEGLKVRVILDCYGAAFMAEGLADLMTDAGVELKWFRPLSRWKVWKTDNRTHRKVLICDGEIGFTGGVGIAREWEGDARDPSEWRETHFRITGSAVSGLQAAFMENWVETEGYLPLQPDWQRDDREPLSENDDVMIQAVRTTASVRWSDIVMLYQTLIRIAQESIYITTAYFNPNRQMVQLLSEAVDRGVEVQIMMPGKYNDQRLARLAGEETFEELLEGGVKLWYYQKTMFHSKAIVIDRMVSCIGSANFNHRSMLKDDEINLVCINEALATELISNFEDDLEHAEAIDKSHWERRSFIKRSVEKIITLGRNQI